jgi:arabinan endo-1,5-alpha-L-arabinosidase
MARTQTTARRKVVLLVGVLLAALGLTLSVSTPAAAWSEAKPYPDPEPVAGGVNTHDPSMIRAKDGSYYVFSTHNGIEIRHSTDRVHWLFVGEVLPNGATWASAYQPGGAKDAWAPDVSYHGGVYYLYYAISSFGSNHSAIGLATSHTLRPGSWQDQGLVYASQPTDDFNAIDPALTVDISGRWWLSMGSFWSGIKLIELDPSTGKPAAWNTTRYSLAQRPFPDPIEGSYIYRHGGYYYLFASFDFCCQGLNSTYNIRVGRSALITGPYVDEAGIPMLSGGGTTILATHGYVIGPGGQTVLRDRGHDLLVYHFYDRRDAGTPRLGLNRLAWDAGWPSVAR